jgi:hypothetical protein
MLSLPPRFPGRAAKKHAILTQDLLTLNPWVQFSWPHLKINKAKTFLTKEIFYTMKHTISSEHFLTCTDKIMPKKEWILASASLSPPLPQARAKNSQATTTSLSPQPSNNTEHRTVSHFTQKIHHILRPRPSSHRQKSILSKSVFSLAFLYTQATSLPPLLRTKKNNPTPAANRRHVQEMEAHLLLNCWAMVAYYVTAVMHASSFENRLIDCCDERGCACCDGKMALLSCESFCGVGGVWCQFFDGPRDGRGRGLGSLLHLCLGSSPVQFNQDERLSGLLKLYP